MRRSFDAHDGDPLLAALASTRDPARRELLTGRLLTEVADPVIRRSLGRRNMLRDGDADDIHGVVMVRLLRRLESADEPIASFADYVAMVTFHAIDDHLRRRQPQRTLLANRIRYVLTRDPRFALWERDRDLVCGLAEWQNVASIERRPWAAAATPVDPGSIPASLERLFRNSGVPIGFHAVVSQFAAAANLDIQTSLSEELDIRDDAPSAIERVAAHELLEKLWREIVTLPQRQRSAILLNLRDDHGNAALPLFPLTGVATLDALAETLEMPREALAELWIELPLDDQRIAALLGATRQQVINLRKSGRERLARRMARW